MTREEAIILIEKTKPTDNSAMSIMLREALDMAIKALEHEPKTGHWYRKHSWEIYFTCDACGTTNASGTKYNYCPSCGARMVDPQESEE